MVGSQRLLAIAISFLLAGIPGGGRPEVLGIIVQANRASLGAHTASEGTAIYDGDRLSTDAGGVMQLRSGRAALALGEESSVIVRGDARSGEKGLDVDLLSGTVTLSAGAGEAAQIHVLGALVRPGANTRVGMQVRMLGAKEIIVFARRGSVLFSYHEESVKIPEGKSYRVLLDPADGGATSDQNAKKPNQHGKAFLLIAIGITAASSVPIIWKAVESPDRP
jgi:hypothetical protein